MTTTIQEKKLRLRRLGWGKAMVCLLIVLGLGLVAGCFPSKNADHADHADGKKILFYRNPMNPQITSPVPMKDSMGMDYIPVYETKVGAKPGEISLSAQEQALAGVKTARVGYRPLHKEIRTVGTIAYDPDLYVAQEEFISALRLGDDHLVEAGRMKLQVLGLNAEQIDKLQKAGKAQENLFLPNDQTWAYVTIYENETGLVKAGTPVMLDTVAFPGVVFSGKVAAVSAVIDPMTRSATARIEIENTGKKLKPGMYANATIMANLGNKLAIDEEAVINTGKRTLVVVSNGEGKFHSREVKLGQKADGYYEVLSGLEDGDLVVTNGNFLIDSESRLQSTTGTGHQH